MIAVVLLVGAIAEFMWWILAAIVVYWLYCGGRRVLRWYQAQAFASDLGKLRSQATESRPSELRAWPVSARRT